MSNEEEDTSVTSWQAEDSDLLWSETGFAHAQRVAKLFASSMLVPDHLRGKVADVTIALLMARRLKEDPLVVMQAIHSVRGKAGWSAQYIIARANRSEVFKGSIGWRIEERPHRLTFKRKGKGGSKDASMPDLTVTAFATKADTGDVVEFSCSSQMAIEERWSDNDKYSSLAELMLRYRSATFLVRLYAPEVMLGISTVEEIETMPEAQQIDPVEIQNVRSNVREALGMKPKNIREPALIGDGEQVLADVAAGRAPQMEVEEEPERPALELTSQPEEFGGMP